MTKKPKPQKVYNSLTAFKDAVSSDRFNEFVCADNEKRKELLSSYGLKIGGTYKGRYDKQSNTVTLISEKNPFTQGPLRARLLSRIHLKANSIVTVKLYIFKDNNTLTPDNVFTCKCLNSGAKPRKKPDKRPDHGDFRIYSKAEIEREVERKKQENKKKLEATKEKMAREKEKYAVEIRNNYRGNSGDIKSIIEDRKIRHLIHFTRVSNLVSIIDNGILPVTELKARKLHFDRNDVARFDFKTNCTSLSIEYPNAWVLRKFMGEHPGESWAIIVLSTEPLLENKCYFAEYNAATGEISHNTNGHVGAQAFEKLFQERIAIRLANGVQRSFDRSTIRGFEYLPTSDQAEILVEGPIDRRHIKYIYFRNDSDASDFKDRISANGMKWKIQSRIFLDSRDDYKGFEVR